jgi:hypothetical protein
MQSARHRRGGGPLNRGGPLSCSAHEGRWKPNHPSGTVPNYVKLAAGLVPHVPLPAVLQATNAVATFHNCGLCITTLSCHSVSTDEGLQPCLKRTVVTRPSVLRAGQRFR